MSEIRQLVVSLTMETNSAQQNLRGLGAAVRQANATFAEAAAGIKGFENTTAGMKAKVQQLSTTLDAQKKIQQQYAQQVDNAGKRLETAKGKQEGFAKAVKDAEAAYKAAVQSKGKDAEETQRLGKELDKAKGAYAANEKAITQAANAVNNHNVQLTNANAKVKQTEAALKDAESRLSKYGHAWSDAARKAAEATKAFSDKAVSIGRGMTRTITMPIVGLGTAAVKAAIDWDTAWVGVQKTVDGTAEEMAAMQKDLMALGGELPETLSGIAGVAEAAGQLGIQNQNIAGFTRVMVNLGNATNLTANEAATAAAQFANIYQMNQADFDRWGSAVVELGNNYATTERDIVEMSMRLAAAGKQAKLSEADTLALAASLSSLGLEAQGGGSAMSRVMMDMGIAAAKGGKQLNGFAKISGMSAKEFKAQWESDPAQAIDAFIQGLGRIEKSGGNVALTLQDLGYRERLTLDALQRLTGAGDLFTRTLQSSNSAWRDNTALTREAEQRNNSLAGILQRTKNRITAASVEIGNKLTPYLRKAADTVSGLVERFRDLDPATQASIIKIAGIAAAIGPVILIVGKLAGALSSMFTLFAGPMGWAALAVGAVGALSYALLTAQTPAEQLKQALKNIEFKVDQTQVDEIQRGIEQGIEAANKKYDITLSISTDTEALSMALSQYLSDGKFLWRERNDFAKEVSNQVNTTLKLADASLQKTVESLTATMDKLDIPESEQQSIIANVTEKTTTATGELATYKEELDKLLAEIGKNKGAATNEQIAALETLLAKIGAIRTEITLANDEAVAAAKAAYTLASAGQGDGRTLGTAVGYVEGQRALEVAAINERLQADLAEQQRLLDEAEVGSATYNTIVQVMAKTSDDAAIAIGAANTKMTEQLNALFAATATRTGADAQLQEIERLRAIKDQAEELANSVKTVIDKVGTEDYSSAMDGLKQQLATTLENTDLPEDTKIKIQDFISAEKPTMSQLAGIQLAVFGITREIGAEFQMAMGELGENVDFNSAITTILSGVDASQIDTSVAEGALDTVIQNLFDTGKAEEYGLDAGKAGTAKAVEGATSDQSTLSSTADNNAKTLYDKEKFGAAGQEAGHRGGGLLVTAAESSLEPMGGVGTNAAANLVTGLVGYLVGGKGSAYNAGYDLGAAAARGINDGADIKSPSKKSEWSGTMIVEGLKKSLTAGLPSLAKLSATMGSIAIPSMVPSVATAGSVSRTLNANTNLNIQNMTLQNGLDAQALAAQLEGERRRRVAGYGSTLRGG